MDFINDHAPFLNFAVALAAGLLIGLERGWRRRDIEESEKIAGFRTFGLIGAVGGLAGLIDPGSGFVIAGGIVALALLLNVGYRRAAKLTEDVGATTVVAALVAYGLGAAATQGYPSLSAAGAVVTAFLLGARETMHGMIKQLQEAELKAFLRLLLISIVILPVLPNTGYGPYGALNPYEIWWMVVLISGLSFAAYVGVRLFGEKQGLLMTAALGGLVSSTAVAASFGRYAQEGPQASGILSAGVVLASTIMFARIGVVLAIVSPVTLNAAWPFLLGAGVAGGVATYFLWRRSESVETKELKLGNPLELRPALLFAALLAAVLLAARFMQDILGPLGLFMVAAASGVADVDAVTLSVSRMTADVVTPENAAIAISIAAVVNTLIKAGYAVLFSRGAIAAPVILSLAAASAVGAGALFVSMAVT